MPQVQLAALACIRARAMAAIAQTATPDGEIVAASCARPVTASTRSRAMTPATYAVYAIPNRP
jgi:hypothetical protein